MIVIEPTPANKAKIDSLLPTVSQHALPIWLAVRDLDITYLNCPQDPDPFASPPDRRTVAIFGDDFGYGTAKGPDGFHRASLAAYLGQCRTIALVTCEAITAIYVLAASVAEQTNGCTAVIESLPEKEVDWLAFLAEVAGNVPLALATSRGEGGLH